VRELLTNVVKHAHAHKVKVFIRRIDKRICVTVKDDGVGFNPDKIVSISANKHGFGLFSQ
jgi:two-component system NarL family sensor kinase